MDDNNLNDMIKKAQDMINNNQIPPELQSLVKNFNNVQNSNNQPNNTGGQGFNNQPNNFSTRENSSYNTSQSTSQSSMPNIDIDTLMKMQSIMSKMQNSSDNDMSRLLSSLKPYLRDDKKGKVDEYMKLVKMGQMTKILENLRW